MRYSEILAEKVASPYIDTPAFKTWFAGSKVVDANGNPLPVFHGTFEDFKEFKRESEKRVAYGLNRLGYWFDVNTDTPSYFAGSTEQTGEWTHSVGNIMVVYLSIKKPWIFYSEPLRPVHRKKLDTMIAKQAWGQLNAFVTGKEVNRRDSYDHLIKVILDRSPTPVKLTDRVRVEALVEDFRNEAMKEGFDGICLKDTFADAGTRNGRLTDWWIAFHSNQIKSVTGNVGTFDPTSDDISA